jgi:hypothetical protein
VLLTVSAFIAAATATAAAAAALHPTTGAVPQLHAFLAERILNKPLVVEEFGLTWHRKTLSQQRVLMQVLVT